MPRQSRGVPDSVTVLALGGGPAGSVAATYEVIKTSHLLLLATQVEKSLARAWKMFTRSEGKVAVDMGTGL